MIREFLGYKPKVAKTAYIDPQAMVIGRVIIKNKVTVWPGAVLRADEEEIVINSKTAILDGVIIEAPKDKAVHIGENVLISHGAIVHGAKIEDDSLVGIGAIILDGAKVSSESIIGAGSVVTPNSEIPAGKLALGTPAEVIRETSVEEIESIKREIAELIEKAKGYR